MTSEPDLLQLTYPFLCNGSCGNESLQSCDRRLKERAYSVTKVFFYVIIDRTSLYHSKFTFPKSDTCFALQDGM